MTDEQTLRDEVKDIIRQWFDEGSWAVIDVKKLVFLEADDYVYDVADEIFKAISIPDKLQDLPLRVWRELFHENMIKEEEDKR